MDGKGARLYARFIRAAIMKTMTILRGASLSIIRRSRFCRKLQDFMKREKLIISSLRRDLRCFLSVLLNRTSASAYLSSMITAHGSIRVLLHRKGRRFGAHLICISKSKRQTKKNQIKSSCRSMSTLSTSFAPLI